MARVILNIEGDARKAYKTIADLQTYADKLPPIKLKIEATGVDKATKGAIELAKAQAKAAAEARKLAQEQTKLEKIEKQEAITSNQARTASLQYGKQAEATRTQEARRRAEVEAQTRALNQQAVQEERTRTEAQRTATQVEKTRTAEVNRATATERTRAALANLRNEQDRTTSSASGLVNSIHAIGDAYAKLWSRITSTITRRLINQAFTALKTTIKDTLEVMKEVDTQLINIQKVSGKSSEEIAAIGERAYDTAAKYGVAVEDYLSAVYSFQKAGLGESAEQMAELATKTMLVGDTTAAVAEKFLISSNAAWELHGNIDELNKVIDQADYINNNYATTLDKIAAGLPIVASVAANAGMTYSETMAALGTIQSITQESGTKSATALRALILNIEKEAGTYLTDEGEEFEVTEESIKGLQGLLEKYAKTEMDAARATGELINPMTAIKALFEGMKNSDVTDIELFQLLSSMGGKLRTNQLTALVKNFDMFDQMLVELGGSAGTADKEVGLMLESWSKKTQILKDRWQQFIAKLVSTDAIKGFIDDITEFVTNLDAEQIGAAIKDVIYPIIDFIKNVDWAGAAQHISSIFDKIAKVAAGTGIAAGLAVIIGALEKIFGFLGSIGGILGIGGAAGVVAGGGIIGGLVIIGKLLAPIAEHAINVDRLTDAADRLNKTVEEQKKAFSDTKAEIDATGTLVDLYIDKLEDLEKQGLDTKEAQDEYQNILDQIVTLMPELAETVEDANGQYENFSSTLRENADAWVANATAQAYAQELGSVAAAKATAEFEKARNEAELASVNNTLAVYDAALKEADALSEKLENGFFSGNNEGFLAAQQRLEELNKQIWELGESAVIQEALARRGELEAAIAESEKKIEKAQAELKIAQKAYDNLQAELAGSGLSEDPDKQVLTNAQDEAAAAAARAEGRRGVKKATEEATQATQEAAQAENEYATAATASGEAGAQAATLTATAVKEDTVPALREVKEALDEIPEEKSITLTPYFGAALDAIREYVKFLDYLHENYSSTLTTTITHDDREHGKYTSTTTQGTAGANGIPARAGGDSNFPGGKTLVNELGPELISENGRAYIAGGGRPTVVNLAPGAIVIPADQTREALKGGMPRYGRASIVAGGTSGYGGEILLDIPSGLRITNANKTGQSITVSEAITAKKGGKGGGKGSGKGGSGSSGSASATVTFDFKSLESALSDTLKLLDAQAKLAENEGDYAKMAEMYEKSQEAIKDLVDKYRQAGYADDSIEIVTLLNKNYDYAKKQLDLYEGKWNDLIKALEADTDATKALKDLEEKRVALEEAVTAYEKAQKQRTVRMYNAATGQWEWIADEKQVQSAKEKVTSAEETYNTAVKKQAIEELKKMKDSVTDLSDIVLGPALSAVVTMSETSDEFQAFARALDAVFGVGSFLQSTEGTTKALSTVDSHDTNYSFGGVSLTEEQAASMTLKELAQMLQVLKLT